MSDADLGVARAVRCVAIAAGVSLALFAAACGTVVGSTDLATLVQQDSTYVAPDTHEPFTGRVYRRFPDEPGRNELEGVLKDGVWDGELTVYHPSGRIRYQGELHRGAPCGVWVENREDEPPGSLYQELKQEIESMGVYDPCPEG